MVALMVQLPAIVSWLLDLCLLLSPNLNLQLCISSCLLDGSMWTSFCALKFKYPNETYWLSFSILLIFPYSLFPRCYYCLGAKNISWRWNSFFTSTPSMSRKCGSFTFWFSPLSGFHQLYFSNSGLYHLSPELLLCSPCLSPCLQLSPSVQPSLLSLGLSFQSQGRMCKHSLS